MACDFIIRKTLLNKSNFCLVDGSDHASSGNTGRPVSKQKFRSTNWHIYNRAFINRDDLTFWLDDEVIQDGMSQLRLHPGAT